MIDSNDFISVVITPRRTKDKSGRFTGSALIRSFLLFLRRTPPFLTPREFPNSGLLKAQAKLQRGIMFALQLPPEADAHYAGKGVLPGAVNTPIFWYRPKDSQTYRVIYADLSILDMDVSPSVSASLVAKNIGDKAYADRADFAFGNERYFPGKPRSYVLRMLWRF